MGRRPTCEAVSFPLDIFSFPKHVLTYIRGLYDPSLEKDACGVGFAW